jgi:hypothetical protein
MRKTRANLLLRLHRLGPARRLLLARATVTLSLASAAIAFLPFRISIRSGSATLRNRRARFDPDDCVWAIETAARRLPFRTMCIEKGVALQRMLRKEGIDARLHYGARKQRTSGDLEAHVWVTVGTRTMIGGAEAAEFTAVAIYP